MPSSSYNMTTQTTQIEVDAGSLWVSRAAPWARDRGVGVRGGVRLAPVGQDNRRDLHQCAVAVRIHREAGPVPWQTTIPDVRPELAHGATDIGRQRRPRRQSASCRYHACSASSANIVSPAISTTGRRLSARSQALLAIRRALAGWRSYARILYARMHVRSWLLDMCNGVLDESRTTRRSSRSTSSRSPRIRLQEDLDE